VISIFFKLIKPTAYLEVVQCVAALGPLNERTSSGSGMETRAEVQLEGVDACCSLDAVISVTESVAGSRVDFKVPSKYIDTINYLKP